MAKFSQNTLNQVAGFNGQILAQELVYNQRDYWNLTWISNDRTNTPVDLTDATIDATIVRRAITDYRDTRTGLDFTVVDYPINPLLATVTHISNGNNRLTCDDTSRLTPNRAIKFGGQILDGLNATTTYYVKEIIDPTHFTISLTPDGDELNLSNGNGVMTVNIPSPSPIALPITNVNNSAGSFTMTIDDATWGVISGDPELDINANEPACFTGRIKVSFDASGSQPAYDETVFLLFLIRSDGVINYG